MHLLVGLGNIGREYELTRHNFGFMLMDQILDDYGFQVQSKKFKSEVFYGEIDGRKILALKPQTFMNRSGFSVAEAANFYKIETLEQNSNNDNNLIKQINQSEKKILDLELQLKNHYHDLPTTGMKLFTESHPYLKK
jgi:hypothetical protein